MSPELEQSLGPPLFWDFLRRKGYGLGPPHQWYKTELQKSPPCPPPQLWLPVPVPCILRLLQKGPWGMSQKSTAKGRSPGNACQPSDHTELQLEGQLGPRRLGFSASEGHLRDGKQGNVILTRPSAWRPQQWATSLG